MDNDSSLDLWDLYADYINGTKEIAECNAAFKTEYISEEHLKRIISVILTAFMTVSLVACAKSNPFIGQRITIDENGMATWEAFPDATGYHVEFVHWEDCPIFDYEMDITENCVQLQKGQGIIVSPLFADGSKGDSISSDYWGSGYVARDENAENNNGDPNIVTEGGVFYKYDIDEDDLSTWEVVS